MSKVYISSDWHIGHKNIYKFRHPDNGFPLSFEDEREHREWLFEWVKFNIKKRDTLYLLGDIAFDESSLLAVHKLPGRKILVKGNHCTKSKEQYKVYEAIHGLFRYKSMWLSHAPIHPQELRGKPNLHGHVHHNTIDDPRYFNCCVENLVKVFNKPCVPFEDIASLLEDNRGDS